MANAEYIAGKVSALIKRYGTRDPFALSQALDIRIRYKDLGDSIKAYYFYQSRIKNIVINHRADIIDRNILCAHELGHAVLHTELAMMKGFQELTLFDSMVPTEYEANLFAAELLIDDADLLESLRECGKSFFSIAKELCVPPELLDFKLRILKKKGYPIVAPILAKSDFLKSSSF